MPSIMGAIDAILEKSSKEDIEHIKNSTPKRSPQANNFANLSPNVQKILSNVSDLELSTKFTSEESIDSSKRLTWSKSRRLSEKALHKSSESLDVISPSVQKMLSNLPDSELVISTACLHHGDNRVPGNNSFLYATSRNGSVNVTNCLDDNKSCTGDGSKSFLYHQNCDAPSACDRLSAVDTAGESVKVGACGNEDFGDLSPSKPLGNYYHTSPFGIASRTPVGRKNMGKFLQVSLHFTSIFSLLNVTVSVHIMFIYSIVKPAFLSLSFCLFLCAGVGYVHVRLHRGKHLFNGGT